MKVSRLAAALGACLILPSASLHALGMGDIDIHSGLNQPLDASIRLISVAQDELDGLEVKLAPRAAFERMGIERLSVLSSLVFEVVEEDGSTPYVRVSSSVPVREPFLDFILSVNWANGQMLREYTLLLDPPIFSEEEQPSPIEAVVSAPASISRDEIRDFINTVEQNDPFGASYGPVKRDETLWAIAQEMRPDSSVSVPQMMLALLKENPGAFINGNINSLKEGYILRAPQLNEINATSEQRAGIEASRQYQQWLAQKGASPSGQRQLTSNDTPIEQMPTTGLSVDARAQPSARLQLVSPDDASFSGSEGGAEIAALQKQLTLAVEATEAGQQENAELQTRLVELEKQLADMQRLITLQDDTMTALQSGLAQGDELQKNEVLKPAEAIVSPPVEQSGVVETAPEIVADALVEDAQAVSAVDAPESSSSSMSWTDPKVLAMGGGAFVVLLIVALMIRKRRKASDDDFFDSSALPIGAVGTAAVATAGSAMGNTDTDTSSKDDVNDGLVGGVTEGEDYSTFGGAELGTIHAEESDIDPIAEADVYLAYRRYEQAEALLVDAIAGDGERQELKLKLLEIYFTTKDNEAFEAQAEVLYAALNGADNGVWTQAVEMGNELCPDHPLFSGSAVVGTSSATDFVGSSDDGLASSLDNDALDFESLLEPEPTPVSESDNDFDLGVFSEDSEPALGVVSDEALAEFDLDLDLDDRKPDSKTSSALDVDSFADGFGSEISGEMSAENSLLNSDLDSSSSEFELDSLEVDGSGVVDAAPSDTDLMSEAVSTENLDLEQFDDALEKPSPSDGSKDESAFDSEFKADLDEELIGTSLDTEVNSSFDLGLDDLSPVVEGKVPGSEDLVDEISELGFDLDLDHVEAGLDEDALASLPINEVDELFTSDGIDQSIGEEFEIDLDFLEDEFDGKLDVKNAVASTGETDFGVEPELGSLDEFPDLDNVVSFGGPDLPISDDVAFTEDLSDFDLDVDVAAQSTEVPFAAESVGEHSDSGANFADINEEYSLFESADDVVGTKLDLAKAYIDMGDQDGARSILDEVVKEGSDMQKEEAAQLMQQMG